MAVSLTSSNCAEVRNVGILIMLIWVIKISIVKENIAAISAGGGTAAVVILVVVVFGFIYWRRRGKEKNYSSQDHKNQPSSSHRPSDAYDDSQDVSETGFSSGVVSSPNASDDVKLHMKAKEQESTIADLYAVPVRKKKARACTASDTAGDSVQNPSDLYAVPERKKKKNAPPSAIQGSVKLTLMITSWQHISEMTCQMTTCRW
ncbi:uncharacterized protein LOC106172677 [Lingula anatina]|uniref:Uncharacterized protein LOC106172677 n=1 Tax=Lingula anatina TaxID=7574 RepID=A0A1S3JF22_LINAN|nr:uncharacterized protein LOC106172677 [Lingula anatina]|eukprot:XP_013408938.1 uncharacterized protein LOC106172677 [Lingula anatina]